jgi:hypothetical protein
LAGGFTFTCFGNAYVKNNQNGPTQISLINQTAGSSSSASFSVTSEACSGFLGAFSTGYGTSSLRDMIVVGANSDAGGIVLYAGTANQICQFIVGGSTETFRVSSAGVALGTANHGTSATSTIAIKTGTAPTDSPADTVQVYAKDQAGAAGAAALHLRSELGGIASLMCGEGTVNLFVIEKELTDDAYYDLPFSITSGGNAIGFLLCASNNTFAFFYVTGAGTATVFPTYLTTTLVARMMGATNSALTKISVNANTDSSFCIGTAASQNPLRLSNRTGATGKFLIIMFYT